MLKDLLVNDPASFYKLILYGSAGCGKTTFATAGVGNTILIQTEDGARFIKCNKLPICKTFDEVVSQLRMVYKEGAEFDTVAIDSIDALEPLIWAQVCARENSANIESVGGGFQKGYIFALDVWATFIDILDKLFEQGKNIILIAHDGTEKVPHVENETFSRTAPKLHKKANALFLEWADIVAHVGDEIFTAKGEDGKQRAISKANTVMRLRNTPVLIAKNRLGLPDTIPFNEDVRQVFDELVLERLNIIENERV